MAALVISMGVLAYGYVFTTPSPPQPTYTPYSYVN